MDGGKGKQVLRVDNIFFSWGDILRVFQMCVGCYQRVCQILVGGGGSCVVLSD